MSMQSELRALLKASDEILITGVEFALKYADDLCAPKSDGYKSIAEVIAEHYKCTVAEGQRGWTFGGHADRAQVARDRVSVLRGYLKRPQGPRVSASSDPVAKAIASLDKLSTAQLKKVLAHFRAM